MRVTTSKSKNPESFYITKSYTNAQGKSTSKAIRKLGTLAELSKRLGTDRSGVMAWAKEEARLETLKYKSEAEDAVVMIPFHSNKLMDYNRQNFFRAAKQFLKTPTYKLHDVYRALSVLFQELDFIQAKVYKNSFFWVTGTTGSFIMTARTTISRLNRRTGTDCR